MQSPIKLALPSFETFEGDETVGTARNRFFSFVARLLSSTTLLTVPRPLPGASRKAAVTCWVAGRAASRSSGLADGRGLVCPVKLLSLLTPPPPP